MKTLLTALLLVIGSRVANAQVIYQSYSAPIEFVTTPSIGYYMPPAFPTFPGTTLYPPYVYTYPALVYYSYSYPIYVGPRYVTTYSDAWYPSPAVNYGLGIGYVRGFARR